MSWGNIIKAVSVRFALLVLNIAAIWRVTLVWGNDQFWLLTLANVPFFVEGFYVVLKKEGIEWKWLCPCFLFFMMSTLPAIWLLEISRQGTYAAMNTTAIDGVDIAGVRIPIRLNADTWVLIIEECLLYFMILGRWFLPRGDVSREQLSQLLFSFLAIASDIMELFALFDEDVVRGSLVVTYVLLGVWTWSILQFALVLTVYQKPRRAKVVEKTKSVLLEQKEAVRLEIVAIFVSLFMQDGPFLCLRLFCIIQFQLLTYSVVFFTFKNFLVILLLVYRLSILCSDNFCRKEDEHEKGLVEDFEGIEMRNGKRPLDGAVVVVNEGFQGNKGKGGEVRQRSRSAYDEQGSSFSGVVMSGSLKGESDVDRAKVSHQSSGVGTDSVASDVTEIDVLPDPSQGTRSDTRGDSFTSCRL